MSPLTSTDLRKEAQEQLIGCFCPTLKEVAWVSPVQ